MNAANTIMDLYIARIGDQYDENAVKQVFLDYGIGMVEYVDFVATKDKNVPEGQSPRILYYSAFVHLAIWGTNVNLKMEFHKNKIFKLQLKPKEYWMLLPNKKPILRTKVNIHQLAAFTEELFERVDKVEESAKIESFQRSMQEVKIVNINDDIESLKKENEYQKSVNMMLESKYNALEKEHYRMIQMCDTMCRYIREKEDVEKTGESEKTV